MPERPLIVVTTGEPAGVGPEIAVMLAAKKSVWRGTQLMLIGDPRLLEARARRLGIDASAALAGVEIGQVPLRAVVRAGKIDPANSPYVLATLNAALTGCVAGEFAAMVTAPVHKGVINDAGIAFTGHTEYLAEKTATPQVVMLLTGGKPVMRVALATTHLALADVARSINSAELTRVLTVLEHDLQRKFGIARPRILVAGLNPHAGESGYLGREEIDVIAPVIAQLKRRGMRVEGPLPADTLFAPRTLERADAVLAMYHDQGLPVLKHHSFGLGVNVTLGLPVIRTSVDHGTALDLAVSAAKAKTIDPGSLFAAYRLARELVSASGVQSVRGVPAKSHTAVRIRTA
jgi:4-hydroxythreonine-4-phosphate dehydrogenase